MVINPTKHDISAAILSFLRKGLDPRSEVTMPQPNTLIIRAPQPKGGPLYFEVKVSLKI